jgi:hypothetical protein
LGQWLGSGHGEHLHHRRWATWPRPPRDSLMWKTRRATHCQWVTARACPAEPCSNVEARSRDRGNRRPRSARFAARVAGGASRARSPKEFRGRRRTEPRSIPIYPSNRRRTSANGGGANPARSRRARRALGEREKAERHRAIRAAMDELQAEGRETATTTEILERVKSEFEMTPTGVGLTLGNAGY